MGESANPESGSGIEVYCDCGHLFRVARSLEGGIVNCPRCGKAVEVEGGPEMLFWLLLLGGIVLATLAAVYFFSAGSSLAGFIVLLVGGAVILACVLAS